MEEQIEKTLSTGSENAASKKLMLLVTVVPKGKGTFFADFIRSFESNLQVCFVGSGTAHSDIVELLGLKDDKRSIIFSIIREEKMDTILEAIDDRFNVMTGKTGIAFAVPLSSMIGKLSYGFLSNDQRILGRNQQNG